MSLKKHIFKMNCNEVRYYLSDFADGFLIDEFRNQISGHLVICKNCKEEFDNLRSILEESRTSGKSYLPRKNLWDGIISRISDSKEYGRQNNYLFSQPDETSREFKLRYRSKTKKKKASGKGWVISLSVAAVLVITIFFSLLYYTKTNTAFLPVKTIKGQVIAGIDKINKYGILKAGHWLITDEKSKASVKVGLAGEIKIDPETRLRLIQSKDNEYTIQLDRGTIQASIQAPTDLLNIETPSATITDPGCSYKLSVNDYGADFLSVNSGWVSLEYEKTKITIPSGADCVSKLGKGPGIPYYKDASANFINALGKFNFENGGEQALNTILKESRIKDALTLWYLLAETNHDLRVNQKRLIFEKLSALISLPEEISGEKIINGDKKLLEKLWECLGYKSSMMPVI